MHVDLEKEAASNRTDGPEHARLARWAGNWKGTARTWLDPNPDVPPKEAAWEGHLGMILGGRFARFEYRSSLDGTPLCGELVVGFDQGERKWRASWVDSFHTGTAIMAMEGAPGEQNPSVLGSYFVDASMPRWGWRIECVDEDANALTIRMHNITPEGESMLGLEILLKRAS